MFSPLRILVAVAALLVGFTVTADSAHAQGGNVQTFDLADGQIQDFGQNLGRNTLVYKVRNSGQSKVRAHWFDKQTNQWQSKLIKPGKTFTRHIEFGEYFQVRDVADHTGSKIAVRITPE